MSNSFTRARRATGAPAAALRYAPWTRVAVCVLLLLCGGCQLADAVRFSYGNAAATHSWTAPARETSLPFSLIDNHIVLPVRVNGSEPLNFVLDSGAAATVFIDSRATRAQKLRFSGEITVSGVGDGPDPVAHIVRGSTFALGSLEVRELPAILLPLESIPFFGELDDVYFDGVIGAPFFQRFRVAIDYDLQLVTFSEPPSMEHGESPADNWQEIPLYIENGLPYLGMTVSDRGGDAVQVKLLADTGARGAVSLTPDTHTELSLPDRYFRTVDQGLSGDVVSHVAMLDALTLGDYTMGPLPVSYALSGGETESGSNGILGNELLSRFNLVFEYHHKRLLIAPSQRFAEPIYADRSGLQLRPHRLGAIVRAVEAGSGAAESGLEVGDIVTAFNAAPVSGQTLASLKRALGADAVSIRLCWQASGENKCDDVALASRFSAQAPEAGG